MVKKRYSILILVCIILFIASNCISEPLTPRLCKEKVIAAAKLLQSKGDAALDEIKNPDGEFRFADGKAGYVWIHNLDGIMVMHPTKPSLDGKGLFGLKDSKGRYYFVAFNEMVEENGAGWVPYEWPKPGEEKASAKVSYVMLVTKGEKSYVVGSGMYDVTEKDIAAKFPGDPVHEY